MGDDCTLIPAHPQGEGQHQLLRAALGEAVSVADAALGPVRVQTPGGTVFLEWDAQAALTPIGQLVFFAQFLSLSGLFESLCASCLSALLVLQLRRQRASVLQAMVWLGEPQPAPTDHQGGEDVEATL
jgi:hypothetical protein